MANPHERSDKTRLKEYTYKQLLKLVRAEKANTNVH